MASICQSGLNIYYQSDRTFLTALQLIFLTKDDFHSCLLPKTITESEITFQFYVGGRQGSVDVSVSKKLPCPVKKVPGCSTSININDEEESEEVKLNLLTPSVQNVNKVQLI